MIVMKDQLQGCVNALREISEGKEYTGAPQPQNEKKRLSTLQELELLDTLPARNYDKLTNLVCKLFNVPICLISLVDVNRQWFKSVQGLPGVHETHREVSFCAWTLLPQNVEILVVNDAALDPRFKNNYLVTGEPYIRYYGGCPLVASNGDRLGTLCSIGREPRTFYLQEGYLLSNIAEITIREIERTAVKNSTKDPNHFLLQPDSRKLIRSDSSYQTGFCLLNFKEQDQWEIIFTSQQAEHILEVNVDDSIPFWDLFQGWKVDEEVVSSEGGYDKYVDMMMNNESFKVLLMYRRKSGGKRWIEAVFRPAAYGYLDSDMPVVSFPQDLPIGPKEDFCYYWIELQDTHIVEQKDMMITKQLLIGVSSAEAGAHDSFVTQCMIGQGSVEGSAAYRGIYQGEVVVMKIHTLSEESFEALQERVLSRMPQTEQITKVIGYLNRPGDKGFQCSIAEEFGNEGNLWKGIQNGLFVSQLYSDKPSARVVLLSCIDIAKALVSIHEAGMYHGHLVPNNVLIFTNQDDYRGFEIKVSDAGVHRVLKEYHKESAISTSEGFTESTVPVDGKMSDVYSFGRLAYFMLGGERYIPNENDLEAIAFILSSLHRLADRCVQQQAQQRPTAREVLQTLQNIQSEANSCGQFFSRQSLDDPLAADTEQRSKSTTD
eukprot:TRINITY_DN3148_c0_g2_i1.p1 TRINITY_DN3148_c0_g2~~TRINITY_DN3148_c0_g2_i1.p1  ORF type:complete len:659 (+),score=77.12 TRINITY_DN3148_c0_g2_i1:241-2217(+)